MMTHTEHLDALRINLSHERTRLERAAGGERDLRAVWVAQLEHEVRCELAFLGLSEDEPSAMTDKELLAELGT